MSSRTEHIKPLHLFNVAQTEDTKATMPLTTEEQEHLQSCEECQHSVAIFWRQFSRPSGGGSQGENAA